MELKKSILILILAIFLISIAGVSAADANDTAIASDNTNQMDLSSNNELNEDNLQTCEENNTLTQANGETLSAKADSQILAAGEGTYYDLRNEIGNGGNKNLAKSYYQYTGGDPIVITTSGVINGNGAIIDMAGSNIRAFYVSASDVTIKNLTIKNTNCPNDGDNGAAIYFVNSGSLVNCNFTSNLASIGGAVYFDGDGKVTNCNFNDNKAVYDWHGGSAVYFKGNGNVTNCNFTNNNATGLYGNGAVYFNGDGKVTNCNFTGNEANYWGGAVYFHDGGTVVNCNFTNNIASWGGAIYIGSGTVVNCNFTNNIASRGGAIIIILGSVVNCNFTNNTARNYGGAMCGGSAVNCSFFNNSASRGGALYECSAMNCNFTCNSASSGGAVYMSSGTVSYCNFTGNNASNGGAFYLDSNSYGNALSCSLINNKGNDGNDFYVLGTLNANNSVFLNSNAGYSIVKESSATVNVNNNFWGSNIKPNPGEGIDVDTWIILNATLTPKNTFEGFKINITACFNQTNSTDGTINDYEGKIPDGIPVTFSSNTENIGTSTTKNGTANIEYTVKKADDEITVTCDNAVAKAPIGKIDVTKFSGLQIILDRLNDGDVWNLTDDVTQDTTNHMVISKSITIDGQGHTIDALKISGIFYIDADNVVLKNINFAKGKSDSTGAVYFTGKGDVINCSFTNNTAFSTGAVYFGGSGTVSNCTFTNNQATGNAAMGGVVYFNGNGEVTNCNFTNNKATLYGGAVYFVNQGTVSNCTFTNNSASNSGGAVYFVNQGTASNCIFIDNKGSNGNDIYIYSGSLTASNSVFLNSNAGYSIAKESATVNVNNNFWGTNSKPTPGEGIDADTWIILNVASVPEDMFVGEEVSIVASFNQTNSTDGDISSYTNKLPDGLLVTFSSNTGNIGTVTTKNGKASIQYTVKSTDRQVTVTSTDAQAILPVFNFTTFSGLQKLVNRLDDGGILTLTDDVTQDTTDYVVISKSITIDGQGHTIDALNISRIFYITADNVVLKNINFANGKGDSGGAVYFMGSGTLTNCTFTNNTAYYGGAIRFQSTGNVANCNFIDNKATGSIGWGGAIFMSSGTVANCTFTNNVASSGGAVYFNDDGNATACIFINNSADEYGGAVLFDAKGNVSDCIFINNKGSDGNDIYVFVGPLTVSNSAFLNSNAGSSIAKESSSVANVNDNFWGTNSKPTPGDGIDVSTWIILNAEYVPKQGLDELDEITITASFNQTNSTGGIIADYAKKLNGVPVTFTTNTVRIATLNTKDGVASIKYRVSSEDKQLTVTSGDVVIKLPEKIPVITIEIPDDIKLGDTISINVSCDSNVELSASINGEDQTITNGKISYQIKNVGIQNITVTSKGTYEYVSMAATEYFLAEKINPRVIINPVDSVTAGENVTVKFSTNSNSTDYTITVNGQIVGNNSNYTTTYAGKYTVIVNVKENEWYNTAYNTTIFTVNPKVKTETVVNIGSVDSVTAGKNVTIMFSTNSNSADYTITVNDVPVGNNTQFATSYSGVYTINVNVKGNDEFTDGFNSTTFTVNPKVPISTNSTTFSGLQRIIDTLNDSDVLTLTEDVTQDTTSPVVISKSITIDGQGHTIDALNISKIFNIYEDNVVLKNIDFTNGNSNTGGAVYFMGSGTLTNCTFTNNQASSYGVVFFGDPGTVENCTFTNNTAGYGGAIMLQSGGNVTNCIFTDNKATTSYSYGGAIYMNSGTIANCIFTDNKATGSFSQGGAIYINSGTIANCTFTDNAAYSGGAVYFTYNGNVTDCTFTNNKGTGDYSSGAVYFSGDGNVSNCIFINNKGSDGNDIHINSGSLTASNSAFLNSNDGYSIYKESSVTVNVNDNFWGTNSKPTPGEGIDVDTWFILNAEYSPKQGLDELDEITITASFNQTNSTGGIGGYAEKLNGVPVTFTTNAVSIATVNTKNGIASIKYRVSSEDKQLTVASGDVVIKLPEKAPVITIEIPDDIKLGDTISINVSCDSDVELSARINGEDQTITDGKIIYQIKNVGIQNITVNSKGTYEYSSMATTEYFIAEKINPMIIINPVDSVTAGENVTIKFSTNSNSTDYTITVNGQIVGNNSNYTTTYAGEYTVIVDIKENEWYNSAYNSTTFTVDAVPVVEKDNTTVVIAPIADAKIGDEITIDYATNSNGTAVVKVNNQPVSNNKFTPTTSGTYTVSVEIAENDYYKAGFNLTTVNVGSEPATFKTDAIINISPVETVVAGGKVLIKFSTNSNASYVITVNGAKVGNNTEFTTTTPGVYTIIVDVKENDWFNAAYNTTTFTVDAVPVVEKANTTVVIAPIADAEIGKEVIIDYTTNSNGTAVVKVNNQPVSNNKFTPTASGTYTVSVEIAENDYYKAGFNLTTVNVGSEPATFKTDAIINISPVEAVVVGDKVLIKFSTNSNASYVITVNGAKVGNNTEYATTTPGVYTIIVDVSGNDWFNAAYNTTTFTVDAVPVVEKSNTTVVIAPITDAGIGEEITIDYTTNSNGTAVVKVNNRPIANNKFKPLTSGTYTVSVEIAENDYYKAGFNLTTFTIGSEPATFKTDAIISITPVETVVVGDKVLIKFSTNSNASYVITVNGAKVGNNTEFTTTTPGIYTIIVDVSENDWFNAAYNSTTFTVESTPVVEKANTTVVIAPIADAEVGKEVTIEYATNSNSTNVTVKVNNQPVSNNKFTPATSGTYTVTVEIGENDYYKAGFAAYAFEVSEPVIVKKDTAIDLDVKIDGYAAVFTVNVDKNATGIVKFNIVGDKTYSVYVDVTDGKSVLEETLEAGDYTVTATYEGSQIFNSNMTSKDFKIIYDEHYYTKFANITVSGDLTVSGVLVNALGSPIGNAVITYSVGGVNATTKTAADGSFAIKGTKNTEVSIDYPGSDIYLPTSITVALKEIVPARTVSVIRAQDFTQYAIDYYAGERGGYFKIQLVDDKGTPLANKPIKIGFNGVVYERDTDGNGWAQLQINLMNEGEVTFAVAFLGDDDYNGAFVVQKITVNKKKTSISASAKSYKASAKTKSYTVTLKTDKGSSIDGKTYLNAGKKLTLKLNGVTYTAKTKANGQATFKLSITKKGKFTASINFEGDKTYNAASKSVKITIK